MNNEWVEPGARKKAPFTPDQLRRAKEAAAQDLAASRGLIGPRLTLGGVCAEIVEESDECAITALTPIAARLKYAPQTLVRYCQVTKSAGPRLRDRLIRSPVNVTWETLKAACVADSAQRDYRVGLLLGQLGTAEAHGLVALDEDDFLKALGLKTRIPSDDDLGTVRALPASDLDASMAVVVQAIAEGGAKQERFVHALVQEGGLEALEAVSAGLRKARAQERQWERDEYEEPLSDHELLLRAVLKASKALEQPLGFEPAEVVAALPLDQFEAIDRVCRSVGEWHQKLLAAAGIVAKGHAA
ncbi:hypothetical protein ACFWBI_22930 [Streptomyces sp. NPDC059982]|uniref:hypothetical protein n=1 Tax=unclassified Streptomyces TaxID=2593676 RepID=UPI0036A448A5